MHNYPKNLMHYALCIKYRFYLPPNVVPSQKLCIMRFMHYNCMHYEILYCTSSGCLSSYLQITSSFTSVIFTWRLPGVMRCVAHSFLSSRSGTEREDKRKYNRKVYTEFKEETCLRCVRLKRQARFGFMSIADISR